ncbi:MAG: DUF4012 domain-containing protein [Candidatus Paceibacterota bacterium]
MRLRRPIRRIIWTVVTVCIAMSAMLIGGLVATTPRLLEGARTAQQGADELLGNPRQASATFAEAGRDFDASFAGLQAIPEPAQFPSLVPPFSWYIRLNKAAIYLNRAGKDASALASLYPETKPSSDPSALVSTHSAALGKLFTEQEAAFASLQENIEHADHELSRLPSWIFFSRADEVQRLKDKVHVLAEGLPRGTTFIRELQNTLGKGSSEPHTVLVIFQNDSELRPSGGFMGSYAVLTASNGIIRSFQFGKDIYKLDRELEAVERITPPPYLQTISPTWGFRDSNVGQGFLPEIGSQVADFYSKASGTTPDAILFTDLSILEDILLVTGPVMLPGTTTEVTADSVSTALTTYIEKEYWNTEANKIAVEPKSVIGDLIPVLLAKLQQTPGSQAQLPSLVSRAVGRKSLQLWTSSPNLAEASKPLFATDSPPTGDWMKIVHSNLGGKKSSRNITQHVKVTEKRRLHGRERTIVITRTHTGTGTWPDDHNRNYTEVYLPPSAEIVEVPKGKGGENLLPESIQAELGLTDSHWGGEVKSEESWVKVGFWSTTSVGEKTEFTLKYRLPDDISSQPFTYLKQAGSRNESLEAFGFKGSVTGNVDLEKRWRIW